MGGARKLWTPLLAAACAAALAACGGGDDSTARRTSAGTAAGRPASRAAPAARAESPKQPRAPQRAAAPRRTASGARWRIRLRPAGERSASFRTPGGDNSIQEYGEEGDSADRTEATTDHRRPLQGDRIGEDWDEGLRQIPLGEKRQADQAVSPKKAPQIKGKGCAEVLAALDSGAAANPPTSRSGRRRQPADRRRHRLRHLARHRRQGLRAAAHARRTGNGS